MTDESFLKQAKAIFDLVCQHLNNRQWTYTKDEEKFTISCQIRGNDLPIDLRILIFKELQIITMLSTLPLTFQKDRISDGAMAVSFINWILKIGNFDYDIESGHIVFRLTSSFKESLIADDLIKDMIDSSLYTVEEFNDKFFMLSQGMISFDDFKKRYQAG